MLFLLIVLLGCDVSVQRVVLTQHKLELFAGHCPIVDKLNTLAIFARSRCVYVARDIVKAAAPLRLICKTAECDFGSNFHANTGDTSEGVSCVHIQRAGFSGSMYISAVPCCVNLCFTVPLLCCAVLCRAVLCFVVLHATVQSILTTEKAQHITSTA